MPMCTWLSTPSASCFPHSSEIWSSRCKGWGWSQCWDLVWFCWPSGFKEVRAGALAVGWALIQTGGDNQTKIPQRAQQGCRGQSLSHDRHWGLGRSCKANVHWYYTSQSPLHWNFILPWALYEVGQALAGFPWFQRHLLSLYLKLSEILNALQLVIFCSYNWQLFNFLRW